MSSSPPSGSPDHRCAGRTPVARRRCHPRRPGCWTHPRQQMPPQVQVGVLARAGARPNLVQELTFLAVQLQLRHPGGRRDRHPAVVAVVTVGRRSARHRHRLEPVLLVINERMVRTVRRRLRIGHATRRRSAIADYRPLPRAGEINLPIKISNDLILKYYSNNISRLNLNSRFR